MGCLNLSVVKMSISFFGHPSAMVVESFEISLTMVDKFFEHSLMEANELFKFSLRS